MPRRDVTADWSFELDDSFQGRVVDGSLQFVSAGPPARTVWLAVWSPPMSEPAESNIAWAKQTAASSGVQGAGVQEFDEPGSDPDELRYARWYAEAPDGRPRWTLNAYTARRGDLVQAAFLSDSAEDLGWALSAWRSLRTRRADAAAAPVDEAPAAAAESRDAPPAGDIPAGTAFGAGIVELGVPSVEVAGFPPPSGSSGQPEAATEQPATEPPAPEPPAAEQPAAEQPAAEQPAAEQPAREPDASEPPAAEPAGADVPVAETTGTGAPEAEVPEPEPPLAGASAPAAAAAAAASAVTTGWSTTTTVGADQAPATSTAGSAETGELGSAAAAAFADTSQAEVEAAQAARSSEYARLGQIDPAPIPVQLNPMLRAPARWPTQRQEFRRIRRGRWTMIASSGLSDPYTDPSQTPTSGRHGAAHRVGLGVEVFVEADDPSLTGLIEAVPPNWATQLAWQAAQNVALNGLRMVDWLNEYRIGSIEFHDIAMPLAMPQFIASDALGRPVVGALLGLDAPDVPQTISLPNGQVRMLAVTIITARELDYVRQAGAAGRQWLAGALAHAGSAHRSSLVRASLI